MANLFTISGRSISRRRSGDKNKRPLFSRSSFASRSNYPAILIDHVRRRLEVLVHRDVALPLIDEPVAHAKLEAQLLHVSIEGIEMLVMEHARRHMNGIALVPIVTLAADLGIAVAFQSIEVSFRMSVAMALGVRQVDEDRA